MVPSTRAAASTMEAAKMEHLTNNDLISPQISLVQHEGPTYSQGEQLHTDIATNAMIPLPLPLCRAHFGFSVAIGRTLGIRIILKHHGILLRKIPPRR